MPEEFGFQQFSRETPTIQLDDRSRGPWAILMQPTSKNTFADPSFSLYQDRTVGIQYTFCKLSELADTFTFPRKWIQLDPVRIGFLHQVCLPASVIFQSALNQQPKGWQLYRLGQELISTYLNRINRELDRTTSGEKY